MILDGLEMEDLSLNKVFYKMKMAHSSLEAEITI